MPNTPRLNLPYPPPTATADVPRDVEALALALDSVSMFGWGDLAERPAPGTEGRRYFAVDERREYLDIGAEWIPIGPGVFVGDQRLWQTGDLCHSIRSTKPGWLPCNGTAVTAGTAPNLRDLLIAEGNPFGVSGSDPLRPDYRGRALYGVGTHADVNELGDNDGVAVGSRRPSHRHSITHTHTTPESNTTGNIDGESTNTTVGGSGSRTVGGHRHKTPAMTTDSQSASNSGFETPSFGVAHIWIKA